MVTSAVHEVEAAPGGARSHVLRGTERPGDRAPRTEKFGPTAPGYPNYPGGGGPAASSDDTGNRVSVNGGEGQRVRATGDRAPTPATEVGQPAEVVGEAPCRATGRAPRDDGPGDRGPGPDSGDGDRATDRRGRGGEQRRVTDGCDPKAAGPGDRSTGRKAASPAGLPREHDGRCIWSRRRLTPVDRPVVDRSTFRVAPGGCAGSGRRHRPGLLSFSGRSPRPLQVTPFVDGGDLRRRIDPVGIVVGGVRRDRLLLGVEQIVVGVRR